jgi:histidine phosphotransfer protein HptB
MPHDEPTSAPGAETATGPVVSEFAGEPGYGDLLRQFVASTDRLRSELAQRLERGDIAGLAVQAHQLKGAAGGYGFPELSGIAADLEAACVTAAASAPAEDAPAEQVLDELERLLAYLGRITT